MVHRLAHQNPAHVRPPFAVDGRMRIAIFTRILMMNAVGSHPENGSALERQRSADRQEILDPLRSLVAAVCEQAMIAHADAQAARHPPQEHGDEQRLPCEEEKSGHCSNVEEHHECRGHPIKFAICSLSFFQAFQLHFHEGPQCLLVLNTLTLYLTYQETGQATVILV